MCKKKYLRSMMAIPLKTTYENLTKFCNIVKDVGVHIDLSAKTINEKINAMEAPLLKTISDLPDELKDKIIGHYTSMISTIFTSLKTILFSLSKEIEKGHTLIPKIVDSFSKDDREKIVNAIRRFFKEERIESSKQKLYFDGFFPKTDNFDKLIKTYIRNIYFKILYPSIKTTLEINLNKNIEYFSNRNNTIFYFQDTKLQLNIKRHLFSFMSEYTPKLDDRLIRYISNLIDDVIDNKYVYKLPKDNRDTIKRNDALYVNDYYLLLNEIENNNTIGSEELTPNKNFVVEVENPDNNFTHEECKKWTMMPIFNPRTIEPILIDSPLYNLLLYKSFHYDRNLIPRMITSRGFKVISEVLFTEDYYDKYASDNSESYDSESYDSDDT